MGERQEITGVHLLNRAKSQQPETSDTTSNRDLLEIFEGGTTGDPLQEIQKIYGVIADGTDTELIRRLHTDVTDIFTGKYPGFRRSSVKYHDLRHTRNVVLATIRLFHALHCQSIKVPPALLRLTITCAYFHDTGMLLAKDDNAELGSAYLPCHEERSIAFARQYMKANGYPLDSINNCESVINSTNLTINPATLNFGSADLKTAGSVLGTADILAQMADRYYLECLPLLFKEQLDAGIHEHASEICLMRNTSKFYHEVIENRLQFHFNNVHLAMQIHFLQWWGLDRNLYMEFINKNIQYLEQVISKYDHDPKSFRHSLRRKTPLS